MRTGVIIGGDFKQMFDLPDSFFAQYLDHMLRVENLKIFFVVLILRSSVLLIIAMIKLAILL